MAWTFVLTDLTGAPLGEVNNAYERRVSLVLNGLSSASFRVRMDNPLATEITTRVGDVMLKAYQGSTLKFIGDLLTVEEQGDSEKQTLVCNFASPFWRLTKRFCLTAAPSAPNAVWFPPQNRDEILMTLLDRANGIWDTGLRRGTQDTLYVAQVEETTPWNYKPISEAFAEFSAISVYAFDPTPYADNFTQGGETIPPLTGRAANIGGIWTVHVAATSVDNLFVNGRALTYGASLYNRVLRLSHGDLSNGGVFAVLPVPWAGTSMAQVVVQFTSGATEIAQGVVLRYQDTYNWLMATLEPITGASVFRVRKCVNGVVTQLGTTGVIALTTNRDYVLRLNVDAAGMWQAWLLDPSSAPFVFTTPTLSGGPDSALATGGALERGKVGFYDMMGDHPPDLCTRSYDDFTANVFAARPRWDAFPHTTSVTLGGQEASDYQNGSIWTVPTAAVNPYFADLHGDGQGHVTSSTTPNAATLDTGCFAWMNSSITGASVSQTSFSFNTGPFIGKQGVVCRLTGGGVLGVPTKWVMATVDPLGSSVVSVRKFSGGVVTPMAATSPLPLVTNEQYSIRLQVDADGAWAVWFWKVADGDPVAPIVQGKDASGELATGGVLANGSVGIYDVVTSASPVTRTYWGFVGGVPNQSISLQGMEFEVVPSEPSMTKTTTPPSGTQALGAPSFTFNVVSTAGFTPTGSVTTTSSAGPQAFAYAGKTATSLTGCSGGLGTVAANVDVVYGLKLGTVNVAKQFGAVKPNAVFEYGGGANSAIGYGRAISRDGLANIGYALPTPPATDVQVGRNDASIVARGIFEAVVSSDISDSALRQAFANSAVGIRGNPRQMVTIIPSATAPVFGTDYFVGDTVTARATAFGITRLNYPVRVYGVEVSIDENGKETYALTLSVQ